MQNVEIGLVDQVRMVAQKQNRIAGVIGSWLAKLAPLGSFGIAHFAPLNLTTGRGLFFSLLLLACLAFSAPKVYRWARSTFGSLVEALGFVVLTEGLSLAPHDVHWVLTLVSVDALLVLLGVNAVMGAVRVSLSQRELRAAARAAQAAEKPISVPAASTPKKTTAKKAPAATKKAPAKKRPAATPKPFSNV